MSEKVLSGLPLPTEGGRRTPWLFRAAVSRFTLMMATAALLTLASAGLVRPLHLTDGVVQQLTCPRIHRTDVSMMADGGEGKDSAASSSADGGGAGATRVSRRTLPQPSGFQRTLLSVASTPFITHQQPLPLLTRRLISDRARLILAFCLEYLADEGLDVDMYASGGYVRDLLLGRISDDLDLSLCLVRCPAHVTTASIAAGMPEFARRRPELAVEEAEVVSMLSDKAGRKAMDASQVCLTICGESVLVDLLPTIGSERYDSADRIPVRDSRGSAEADCARRDLTVGAMLLRVTRRPSKKLGQSAAADAAAAAAAEFGKRGNSFVRRARVLAARARRRVRSNAPYLPGAARAAAAAVNAAAPRVARNDDVAYAIAAAAADAASDLDFVILDYHGARCILWRACCNWGGGRRGGRRRQEGGAVRDLLLALSLHAHATAHCVSSARGFRVDCPPPPLGSRRPQPAPRGSSLLLGRSAQLSAFTCPLPPFSHSPSPVLAPLPPCDGRRHRGRVHTRAS